ncbi:MAG: RES domain-containing protein [Caldilineales bacterium]|nr:RES domain-containing protein [Caldilineales bacterium]
MHSRQHDGKGGLRIDPVYNLLGQKTSLTDPNMGAWSYTYDNAGNLQTQTDARACVTTFGYDALNRLTGKSYAGPGACGTTTAVSYTYDAYDGVTQFGRGHRTGMSDGSGSAAWVYDTRGRVTKETKTIGGTIFVTQWSYDAADRVKTMSYPSPGTETVTYAYNPQGLLAGMTSSLGTYPKYVESSVYDAANRLTQRVMRNSSTIAWTTSRTYYPWNTANGLGRLQNITTGSLQNLTYTYDAAGNVKTIVDASNSSQKQCFNYDELDRVTQGYTGNSGCTAYAATGNGPFDEQYTYAANGNLDRRKIIKPSWLDNWYTYNATVSGCTTGTPSPKSHAVSQAGSNTYSYDCNGNMTGRTVSGIGYTLTYDAENRLTQVNQGGTVQAIFVYDGDGNRVQATVGGVTTLYPGQHYEYVNSTTYTKYYFAGSDLVEFERSSGYGSTAGYGRRFVLRDHLGSTSLIVNGSNVTIAKDLYQPFGDVRYQWRTGTPPIATQTQYRYTGQRLEAGVAAPSPVGGLDRGLYFYGARWYDASLARFVQPDTIVPQPGDPQSLNRYTYVNNRPTVLVDPSGNRPTSGCEYEGCSLRNGLSGNSTWQQANGANVIWDPQIAAQEDYNRWIEGVLPAGAMLVGWAAAPSLVSAAVANYAIPVVQAGLRGLGLACVDGDCGNEANVIVRSARTNAEVAQSVLERINSVRFDPASRFGKAFYVAENGQTAVDEVTAHGNRASYVIRYSLDLSKARVLDLTNPSAAKAWGYTRDVNAYSEHQALAQRALTQGYNVIKYQSYRGTGSNYALLENFDFNSWLTPLMISPGP